MPSERIPLLNQTRNLTFNHEQRILESGKKKEGKRQDGVAVREKVSCQSMCCREGTHTCVLSKSLAKSQPLKKRFPRFFALQSCLEFQRSSHMFPAQEGEEERETGHLTASEARQRGMEREASFTPVHQRWSERLKPL